MTDIAMGASPRLVAPPAINRDSLYRKIALRVMPLIVLCYITNSIDRTNVGMAQLHLQNDLSFSSEIYGFGVGIFYLGYILFEVPSNIMLERIGVRKTLLRIMTCWGLVSAATMFVQTPLQFYAVRFLLGVAEAGFYPGILLYITYWFPASRRARLTALFLMGGPIAFMIGAPLSGALIEFFDGLGGLHGWQWMFLIEGLPAAMLGVVAYFYFDDRPVDAKWLSAAEKDALEEDFAAERSVKALGQEYSHFQMLRDPRVYILGIVTIGSYTLASGSAFWSPLLIQASGVKDAHVIGLLAAIPPLVALFVMNIVAWHSDRKQERRWHFACGQFLGAGGLLLASFFYSSTVLVIIAMSLAVSGVYSSASVFTNIAVVYLSERTRAAGLAMMTSIGSLANVLAPMMMGWLRQETGSFATGLQVSVLFVVAGPILLLLAIPARAMREK
jgi:MFS family permease